VGLTKWHKLCRGLFGNSEKCLIFAQITSKIARNLLVKNKKGLFFEIAKFFTKSYIPDFF